MKRTCTKTKREAEVKAKALLKRMKGKGWKIRLMKNEGWYYRVYVGTLTVAPSMVGGYFALLSDHTPGCGNGCWSQKKETYGDPNTAVREAVNEARERLNRCLEAVAAAEKIVEAGR